MLSNFVFIINYSYTECMKKNNLISIVLGLLIIWFLAVAGLSIYFLITTSKFQLANPFQSSSSSPLNKNIDTKFNSKAPITEPSISGNTLKDESGECQVNTTQKTYTFQEDGFSYILSYYDVNSKFIDGFDKDKLSQIDNYLKNDKKIDDFSTINNLFFTGCGGYMSNVRQELKSDLITPFNVQYSKSTYNNDEQELGSANLSQYIISKRGNWNIYFRVTELNNSSLLELKKYCANDLNSNRNCIIERINSDEFKNIFSQKVKTNIEKFKF